MSLPYQNLKRAVWGQHLLHAEQLKATPQRMEVIRVFQKIRKPLCAEDVMGCLPEIKRPTLYRIISLLNEKEIISTSNPPEDYVIPLDKRDRTFYILK